MNDEEVRELERLYQAGDPGVNAEKLLTARLRRRDFPSTRALAERLLVLEGVVLSLVHNRALDRNDRQKLLQALGHGEGSEEWTPDVLANWTPGPKAILEEARKAVERRRVEEQANRVPIGDPNQPGFMRICGECDENESAHPRPECLGFTYSGILERTGVRYVLGEDGRLQAIRGQALTVSVARRHNEVLRGALRTSDPIPSEEGRWLARVRPEGPRGGFIHCPRCNGTYHPGSIARHYQRIHGGAKCLIRGCFNFVNLQLAVGSRLYCQAHEVDFVNLQLAVGSVRASTRRG